MIFQEGHGTQVAVSSMIEEEASTPMYGALQSSHTLLCFRVPVNMVLLYADSLQLNSKWEWGNFTHGRACEEK
jgi:hypothetical protein